MNQQSPEDPIVFQEEADQKKKQKDGHTLIILELPFNFMFNPPMMTFSQGELPGMNAKKLTSFDVNTHLRTAR